MFLLSARKVLSAACFHAVHLLSDFVSVMYQATEIICQVVSDFILEILRPTLDTLRISSLASIDPRLTAALRAIRSKDFSYVHGTSSETTSLLSSLSQDLDHPSSWGDAAILPAYGGPKATKVWQELGVRGRDGVGGIPCEIVHGKMGGVGAIGGSCTKNVAVRSAYAFLEAVALYTPVRLDRLHSTNRRTLNNNMLPIGPHPPAPPNTSFLLPPSTPPLQPPDRDPSLLDLPHYLRLINLAIRLSLPYPATGPSLPPYLPRLLGRPLRVRNGRLTRVWREYLDREWEKER